MIALALGSCMHTKQLWRTCASPFSPDSVYLGRIPTLQMQGVAMPRTNAIIPHEPANRSDPNTSWPFQRPRQQHKYARCRMSDHVLLDSSCRNHALGRPRHNPDAKCLQNAYKMPCAWRVYGVCIFLHAHVPYISREHYSLSLTQQTSLLFLGNAEAENRYCGFFVHFHHYFRTYVGSCRLEVYSFLLSLWL